MVDTEYAFCALVSTALRNDLGGSREAAKTIVRWTGASERTAKNWLTGSCGPSGAHLVQLARYSDEVFNLVLVMAERRPIVTTISLIRLRAQLEQAIEGIDRQIA